MSNLQQRVISAIVLAVVVLGLTWLGGLPFRVLCVVIGVAIYYEWSAMSARPDTRRNHLAGWLVLAAALLALLAGSIFAWPILLAGAAAVAVHAWMASKDWWAACGVLYAGVAAIAMALLRGSDWAGLLAILYLFAVVWSTDIFAYFVGRAVGGPKLAPSISPGKTRSGAAGGAFFAIVAAICFGLAAGTGNLGALAIIALVLSIVSQAGDLFESWVKRRHGVKDSGWLIPGHGGVMDRVDGLAVAAAALYLIGASRSGLAAPAAGLFGG